MIQLLLTLLLLYCYCCYYTADRAAAVATAVDGMATVLVLFLEPILSVGSCPIARVSAHPTLSYSQLVFQRALYIVLSSDYPGLAYQANFIKKYTGYLT